MITLERILVPTDFSECAEQARSYAAELAKRFASEVHLLHVVAPLALPGYVGPIPEDLLHPEEGARKELEAWDEPALKEAKQVIRAVSMGTPFVEVIRYARDRNVDLIVMGTHGRSGIAHALIGSVTERVVRKSPCPVLTVRPEAHQFVMP